MRKYLLLFTLVSAFTLRVNAQYDVWDFQGYAVGADVVGSGNCAMGAMPDVIQINSTFYMYYIARYANVNAIYYATSSDMITWSVQDTIMTASADTNNRIYDIGGPGVMKLSNGQYRLFYRTSQKVTPPNEPLFHIRSMISNDGIHFTHEAGVRVEIQTYAAGSYFKSASHPSVFKDAFGNTRALITGRDTSMNINSPAGLYTATSNDEGLTCNFTPLYAKCHDPVVIRDSVNVYHMYTSYLGSGHWDAVSNDGISWTRDSIIMMQGATVLNEQTSVNVIADIGAAVKPNGQIVLYSNFKPQGPGAWVDIAYYYLSPTSGIAEEKSGASFSIFPNPATDVIEVETTCVYYSSYEILDATGRLVQGGAMPPGRRIDISELATGTYVLCLLSEERSVRQLFIRN